MLDKIETVKIGEKEYPVIFTLNILEKVQEIYGSMDKWNALMFGDGTVEPSIKIVIWTFTEMFNEAIEIENLGKTDKAPTMEHKQVGRIISELGLPGALDAILKSLQSYSGTGDEDPNEKANPMPQ